MSFLGATRTTREEVAPTLDDPLVRQASWPVGGPLGRHAQTGRSWWTPLRVILAVATVFFAAGVVQKSPCVVDSWSEAAHPKTYSHLCYSDISYLYVGRGLAEGIWPYAPLDDLPRDQRPVSVEESQTLTIEYPVLTGLWMGATAAVTHLIGRSPDVSGLERGEIGGDLDVQRDAAIYWGVNAVGFFGCLRILLTLLFKAQRRRPWDTMLVAAAPVLPLAAFINWDLVVLVLVAGFLWAWSTRGPLLAGVFLGLGVSAKFYPLFFLGPLLVLCLRERRLDVFAKTFAGALAAWLVINVPVYLWSPDAFLWFWKFNASRGPDFGSLWLVASSYGHSASPHAINVTIWIVLGAACLVIGAIGLLASRRPRLPQLIFLVLAAFLVINKVYSPQHVLWLLPFAALARPRARDLLIWQACEMFYFFAVWMHIADFFVEAGRPDWVYALAIGVRIGGELFLAALVVRDILFPWHDPVRADGLSDDPLGGVLDEGIDGDAARAPARYSGQGSVSSVW
ncbi:MAG: glycosyltransferase family 87 protein [Nocardioidaceae bacterium]